MWCSIISPWAKKLQLQLEGSVVDDAATHSLGMKQQRVREKKETAAIQLSLIILHLSQFENSEKVKSNFNNYIITLNNNNKSNSHRRVSSSRENSEPSSDHHGLT